MIVFDLACAAGHVFEAWFGSSVDFDGQQARGLISCPLCGATEVAKAVMAPAVSAKSNSGATGGAVAMRNGPPPPAEMKAMLAKLAEAQAKLLAGSENVGSGFADAARAIHVGEAPERPIYGQASVAEARSLIEEGVPVAPLPLPIVPPGAVH